MSAMISLLWTYRDHKGHFVTKRPAHTLKGTSCLDTNIATCLYTVTVVSGQVLDI